MSKEIFQKGSVKSVITRIRGDHVARELVNDCIGFAVTVIRRPDDQFGAANFEI